MFQQNAGQEEVKGADQALLIITSILFTLFGIPGNVITAMVIRHRRMKDSDLTIYLVSLCLFNVLAIAVYSVRNLITALLERDIKDSSYYLCGIWILLSHLTISITSWHHVALATNRALHFTLELKDLRRKWEPHYVVTAVCLFCGIYTIFITNFGVSHTFSEKTGSDSEPFDEKKYEVFVTCELGPKIHWLYIILALNAALPSVAVVSLNIYLMHVKTNPSDLVRKRNGNSPNSMRRQLMKILAIYNIFFVFTTVPYYIMQSIFLSSSHSDHTDAKTSFGLRLSHAFLLLNQAGFFYLACACSARFRQELFQTTLPMLVKFKPEMQKYRKQSTGADSEGSFFDPRTSAMGSEVASIIKGKYEMNKEPAAAIESIRGSIRSNKSGSVKSSYFHRSSVV